MVGAIDQLARDVPPSAILAGRGKVSVNKVTRILERTYGVICGCSEGKGFGLYGRALIANSFKWGLKDKGYPEDFVELATEGLIVAMLKVKR